MQTNQGTNWVKILGITCGVIAILALCTVVTCVFVCGGMIGAGVFAMMEPGNAAKEFLKAVQDKNYDKAYQMMSEDYRKHHDKQELGEWASKLPSFKDISTPGVNIKAGNESKSGKTEATVEGQTDGQVPIKALMVKEGEDWKVRGMKVGDFQIGDIFEEGLSEGQSPSEPTEPKEFEEM
ncbi:MAG: DUF4878 domain-containing protein [Sandaracinaceae bacterium]|nr:DUF4878 domain-containing protein [Sandaracinaceae bacterium]MDW8245949.1 DUF4878 domain-containing protein [Sandaracinaceae bacterium]